MTDPAPLNGKKHRLRITMEDGSVEVKIHDLPENVPEEKIVEFLCAFGEVIYIRELTWGEGYEFAVIKMLPKKMKISDLDLLSRKMEATIAERKKIIEDVNNNELKLSDNKSISEQEVEKYMARYNAWKQSEWGHWLTCTLKEYFGYEFDAEIKWHNVLSISAFHLIAILAVLRFYKEASAVIVLWGFFVGGCAGFGVTAGVHRLWCHKAYKAKLPLRIILMCCYSIAGQNTIYDWVRDHRIHHKYSETDGDPHNSNRGFLYAHVGWLMLRKHPECIKKGRLIDMTDITSDPVVQFHHKHFVLMKILFCFFLPTFIPWYFFGETFTMAFFSQCFVRYVLSLNFTWLVNSAAHIYGNRPYDQRIQPVENKAVSIVAMGEGWHNYHHVFPWDYKAAELGNYSVNVTTFWLDLFAKIGWAYDLKEPSKELVRRTIEKYGDGTHLAISTKDRIEVPDPEESKKL